MNIKTVRDLSEMVLGEPSEPIELGTREDNRAAALELVRQARRSLELMSRDLDPHVYDNPAFVDAIKAFVLNSRRARVRILIRDVSHIVKDGHRLVELCYRLPSYLAIRTLAREHENYNSAFLIADGVGTLYRTHADRFEGSVNFDDKGSAEDLLNLFDEMWEHADAHPDLRRLSL